MKRHYLNLKDAHQKQSLLTLQVSNHPKVNTMPKLAYSENMNNLYVLKPKDSFKRKSLPPTYRDDLYDSYTNKLGIAMSRSSILSDSKEEITGSEKHRSRRNLTNAEHHTM